MGLNNTPDRRPASYRHFRAPKCRQIQRYKRNYGTGAGGRLRHQGALPPTLSIRQWSSAAWPCYDRRHPGIDDEGQLGSLRVKKARQVLNKTDVAVIVVDATEGRSSEDDELL